MRFEHISSWRTLLLAGSLLLSSPVGLICPAKAQQPSVLRYQFAIGDQSRRGSTGSVWLYSYSWYGLQSLKLANIENGVAEIPFDTDKIRRDLDPHPNTDAYVLVLQFPQNTWFRSPEISPESIWKDFRQAFNGLGEPAALPGGDTLLVLPSLTKRRITLLHEDGRPAVKVPVSPSIYLYDSNHCGHHTGLPLGNQVTDDTGTIEVTAPLVPLYLDNVIFYENRGQGPASAVYELNDGLKMSAEPMLVIRKAWNFQDSADLPEQEFKLLVLDSIGKPMPAVDIDETLRANTCGAVNGSVGQTDSAGVARIHMVPQIVAKLELSRENEKPRALSVQELQELFAKKTLTIKW